MRTMDGIIKPLRFVLVGGDLRSCVLARLLAEDGHEVVSIAAENAPAAPGGAAVRQVGAAELREADVVVLPLPSLDENGFINAPLSRMRITPDEVFAELRPRTLVAAGRITRDMRDRAESRKLVISDYFEREELAVQNAIPTAEGAIELAMGALALTLHRARAIVIGFGRIGKLLSVRLRALGADVTASARKYSDLAWIDAFGCKAVLTQRLAGEVGTADVIFNTVPATVLGRAELEHIRPGVPIIDLASKPGGVDMQAALELGCEVIWALSLPGKTAPNTAGRIIRDTIYNIVDGWRCDGCD